MYLMSGYYLLKVLQYKKVCTELLHIPWEFVIPTPTKEFSVFMKNENTLTIDLETYEYVISVKSTKTGTLKIKPSTVFHQNQK